ADGGIRDLHVTGVQTCALPICAAGTDEGWRSDCDACEFDADAAIFGRNQGGSHRFRSARCEWHGVFVAEFANRCIAGRYGRTPEIGRASCREREQIWLVDGEER